MTDNQALYTLFLVLYLWESLLWTPRDAVAFLAPWGRAFRLRFAWPILQRHGTGALMGNPLPPVAAPLVTHPWPVSVTAGGLYAYVAQSLSPDGRIDRPGSWAAWADVTALEIEGRKLFVNGAPFLTAASERSARILGGRLHRVWKEAPERRPAVIEAVLGEALDAERARARIDEFHRKGALPRLFCGSLWFVLFVASPALVVRTSLALAVIFIVPALVFLLSAVAIFYWRAHRALFPADRGERLRQAMGMAVYPPLAIRACDRLGAAVVEGFDPVAVAAAVLAPEAFRDFARTVLLDLRTPIQPACPAEDAPRREAEAGFRATFLAAIERFVRARGLDPAELVRPPAPLDAHSRTYCPRCLDQYVLAAGQCRDCGGLPLQPLLQG